MAGYEDTRQKIISTLMGRLVGTEIQPENHQDYALNMLDYIRSLELIATSTLIGVAESTTTPVQPNSSRVCYIAGVAQNQTVVFENFIDKNGNPISVTTGDMEGVFIILLWNTQYWSAQIFSTNIISHSESATFYYRYNIRKTYESVDLMNSDVESPIGTDGKYIKIGDIVTVVNSTTPSENGIYSYEGASDGWKYQSSFNFQVEQSRSQNTNTSPSSKLFDDELVQVRSDLSALEQEQIQGGVYDVSSHNDGAVFESLQSLLSSSDLSTLIPTSVRCGGMSIRFVQSSVPNSDNNYVQYRLMTTTWSTTVSDWQGIDSEPVAGSKNLVESGVVYSLGKKSADVLLALDEHDVMSGYYYNNSTGAKTANANTHSVLVDIPQTTKVIYAALSIRGTTDFYGLVFYDVPVSELTSENMTEHYVEGIKAEKVNPTLNKVDVKSSYKSVAISISNNSTMKALFYGIDFSVVKSKSRLIDCFYMNTIPARNMCGAEVFLRTLNKTTGVVSFRIVSTQTDLNYTSTVKSGKEVILFKDSYYVYMGAVIDWDLVADDFTSVAQSADNTFILSTPKSAEGQRVFDMFFEGKYSNNGNTVLNGDGVVQSYNCLWEDGVAGTVNNTTYNKDVLEYAASVITYGNQYSVYYVAKTFDEYGNITVDNKGVLELRVQ